MKAFSLLLTGIFLVRLSFALEVTNGCKVEVVGVRVVAVAKDNHDFEWALRGGAPGVTVLLKLTLAEGKIVGLNTDESKVDSFTDDQGTDLVDWHTKSSLISEPMISTWLGFQPQLGGASSDFVKLTAPTQPAKGATQFHIKGKIAVQIASQTNQVAAENVKLASGTELTLGQTAWVISDVRPDGGKYVVSLKTKDDISTLAQLGFYDELGNQIPSEPGGSAIQTSDKGKIGRLDFLLKKTAERVKVVATCWTDLKTVMVPFSVKTGMGL